MKSQLAKDAIEVDGPTWTTPLTGIEPRTVGRARWRRTSYGRGYYPLEGVRGQEAFRVTGGRLPLTTLQRLDPVRGWRTWMLDDPLHWWGMGERVADLPGGEILVAGLGLGLMVHHLVQRADVTRVVVVEIDPDVVALTGPTLPQDARVEVLTADYYRHIGDLYRDPLAGRPDAILWDLAVGGHEQTRRDFMIAEATAMAYLPGVPLFRFGERKTDRPRWMADALSRR